MNHRGLRWMIAAGALGLCAFVVALGANLLPSWASATGRSITPQLVLTWLMIGSTIVIALILATFLVAPSTRPRAGSLLHRRQRDQE